MASVLLSRSVKVQRLGQTALVSNQQRFTYEALIATAEKVQSVLSKSLSQSKNDGQPPRVGLYAAPGPEYIAATWAVWQAGGIVVPLATSHPPAELSYVCQDAGVAAVLTPAYQEPKLSPVAHEQGVSLHILDSLRGEPITSGTSTSSGAEGLESSGSSAWSEFEASVKQASSGVDDGALIIYTSGTTGKPKGVLHTHRSLGAQVASLETAWQMSPRDTLLHSLPLHHVHGIVNALYCPLAAGGTVEMLQKFSAGTVWSRLMSGDISVFMGVPTMYSLLLQHYDTALAGQGQGEVLQAAARRAAAGLRLAVSGSSACPVPIMARWRELSGQTLLERYGMTEIGMALSNPYQGERRPGYVGLPLPGVEVAVDGSGQLLVRGPGVFKEYWGRPQATAEAFTPEGFFLTGDTVSYDGNPPYYRIDGRTSVDIIKSAGYKISALQIESIIMEHPGIAECVVLGVPDETYGEVVTALVAAKQQPQGAADASSSSSSSSGCSSSSASRPDQSELVRLCREKLAPYQVPKRWRWVSHLTRNAMGKVNKKELLKALQAGALPGSSGGADE